MIKTRCIGFHASWTDDHKLFMSMDIMQSIVNPIMTPVLDVCSQLDRMGIKGRKALLCWKTLEMAIVKTDDSMYNGRFIARIVRNKAVRDITCELEAGSLGVFIMIEVNKF